jgi:predicted amidohydrolase YtcJ
MGEWILVDERHVERVGTGDPPAADATIELPGATIVPGFIDAHVHLTATGRSFRNEDVRAARSRRDLLDVVRNRVASADPPYHLEGFDESGWDDPELPSATDLDEITVEPIVVIRTDGHLSLVNGAALKVAEVVEEGVERDESGEPTGRLRGEANRRVGGWIESTYDRHRVEELQLQAAGLAAARGVTSVHEMSLDARDLEVLLGHHGQLPVDVRAIPATTSLTDAIEARLSAIGGDLPVDGSIGARTAAFAHPYEGSEDAGTLAFADDELAEFFHAGHNAGLQVGVHAIGDRAIEQVLGTWERVYAALDSRERRHFRARRHRIEHFELPSADQIERAAMLGLAVSIQPAFDRLWGQGGGMYEERLGPARAMVANPFRTMLQRGIEIGVGSDSPVTPLDPMLAIASLEQHHEPTQRLQRLEALKLHRKGSARLGHQEGKKGVLEPGMHADFVAFEDDPLEIPSVEGSRPILTVSLGREVFRA